MATVSSGSAMGATGPTPPKTPPTPAIKATKQLLPTPTSIRRSNRAIKPTDKVAALIKTPEKREKVQKAPITPFQSPPQAVVDDVDLASKEDVAKSNADGKSDQDDNTASARPQLKLRFRADIVRKSKLFAIKGDNTTPSSPAPTSRAVGIFSSSVTPKNGSEATTITIRNPASKTTSTTTSMIKKSDADSESSAPSENGVPSPEITTSEEDDEAVALSKKTPAKSAKKKTPKKGGKAPKKNTVGPKAPNYNETAKEVIKSAPGSKRGFGDSESSRGTSMPTDRGHPQKIQKVSAFARRQQLLAPEPVVATTPLGPEELDPTAWMFAYGKEASLTYLKEKFPECNFEAYGYGKLVGYKFILHSDGYAKALPEADTEIYGAIYKIPEKMRSTFAQKALKHGMKYKHVPEIQPMCKDPEFMAGNYNAPFISHAEPLKCWMGVCESLDGKEKFGTAVLKNDFFKKRGLCRVIMEMDLAGVPCEYFPKYTGPWVPKPESPFDTGYFIDHKRVKPKKT